MAAARAPRARRCAISVTASAACCGVICFGSGGGDVEARQLLREERPAGRAARAPGRASAGAGRRGTRPPARSRGSSASRSGGATRSAARSERRSRRRRSRTRRSARTSRTRASRAACSAAATSRRSRAARPTAPRRAPSRRTAVHLPVGEAPVAAHERAVERHRRHVRAVHPISTVTASLSSPGRSEQAWFESTSGSIGSTAPARTRSCRAGTPPARAARRDGRTPSRRRCAPDAHAPRARAGPRSRRRSPGVVGVDREGRQVAQVHARAGGVRLVKGSSASAVAARE